MIINFIVATLSEGQPIIDLFNLSNKRITNKLIIYYSEQVSLTITGIGKLNCIVSVVQTFYELKQERNNIWINVGLAGHKVLQIGQVFGVRKIIDKSSQKVFFPFNGKFDIPTQECVTLESIQNKYCTKLQDMECIGFFQAASKFSTSELIQTIKIVSDNEKSSINFNDKKAIYRIISKHNELIKKLCKYLIDLRKIVFSEYDSQINKEFVKIFKSSRFTFTETNQMKTLMKLHLIKKGNINKRDFKPEMNGEYNIKMMRKLLKL